MRHATRIALLIFAFLAPGAVAQELPRPFGFGGLRGRVIDAATEQPIADAIIVARWDWERYYPGGFHSSPSFRYEGEVLNMQEVASAANGMYAIAAWGPVVRGMGQADGRVMVFKSGYEPVERSIEEARGGTIRLQRPAGTPEDIAARIAEWQAGYAPRVLLTGANLPQRWIPPGLRWTSPDDQWKSMPRMIVALHREKGRLREAGGVIFGVEKLRGRSGEGKVLLPGRDERVRERAFSPPTPAIVNITWLIRSPDGRLTRRFVQQRSGGYAASNIVTVSPWGYPQPGPPDWTADLEAKPQVRAYAAGFHASADVAWSEAGATISLPRVDETREARVAELRRWRADIERELASGDRREALAGQAQLIWLLMQECANLTLDAREGLCFDPRSEIAMAARDPFAVARAAADDEFRPHDARMAKPAPPPSRIEAVRVKRETAPANKPVEGFTIGPAVPERKK